MYPFIECLLVFIILSCVLFSVFFHVKKEKICCKLRNMSCEEKCNVLAELIRPFGYCYAPSSDAFSTRIDAPSVPLAIPPSMTAMQKDFIWSLTVPLSASTMMAKAGSSNCGRVNTKGKIT